MLLVEQLLFWLSLLRGLFMARRVFFSFHYDQDSWRVNQVRQSWRFRPADVELPFYDRAGWETVKRQGQQAIKNWIDNQLRGSAVTVVLIGQGTAQRPWVNYEIAESARLRKGLIGIHIHNLQDQLRRNSVQGANPFNNHVYSNGLSYSNYHPTYDWVLHNGQANFANWVEQAARNAGR